MENMDVELGDVDIIDTVQSLFDECIEENSQGRFTPSIYMVPSALRELSPNSFNPRVVSIGPLHKDDENLLAFERQKAKYVHDLLSRLETPIKQTLEECVRKVASSIEAIKACYAAVSIEGYNDNALAKMMVTDSCFILEFIYRAKSNDKIPVNMLLSQSIFYDLVLLENQIPFFVLNDMYKRTILKFDQGFSLVEFILPVLRRVNLFKENIKVGEFHKTRSIRHILSLLHICYQPHSNALSYYSSSTIHSAVELDRAGVNFEPNKDAKWPMDVEVKVRRFLCFPWPGGKPTIKMPVMRIHHFTELVLRNLIAYEQSSKDYSYVTSYAITMDMLIDTQDDVARLVKSKVLVNNIGSNEEAANIMNKICKEIAWVHFDPDKQWEKLDKYCKSYWPKNIERLRHTYFSNPWAIITLIAGILLFILTVIQTFFAIKPPGSK